MKTRLVICFALLFSVCLIAGPASGAGLGLSAETGSVWFSRNDMRIPADDGTRFDMLNLTGTGPDSYIRLYAAYDFNKCHSVRLNIAPLRVDGTGTLDKEALFEGTTFESGVPANGTYKFNTY